MKKFSLLVIKKKRFSFLPIKKGFSLLHCHLQNHGHFKHLRTSLMISSKLLLSFIKHKMMHNCLANVLNVASKVLVNLNRCVWNILLPKAFSCKTLSLQNNYGMTCIANEGYIDILLSGFAFRLKILHERGLSLLNHEGQFFPCLLWFHLKILLLSNSLLMINAKGLLIFSWR